MTTPCRLLIDPPADGAWNMAVDEALLESAAAGGGWTLRFYAWNEPTLSLGYFQAHRDRVGHAASRGLPLVRRASGGGAIVHDRELTYSLSGPAAPAHLAGGRSGPAGLRSFAGARRLYATVHAVWIDVLSAMGIEARSCDAPRPARGPSQWCAEEPFLCFERRAAGDVLVGGHKLAGSAQRRLHGAVLQHGSILLSRSPTAPELPGLECLDGTCLSPQTWVDLALGRLSRALGIEFDRGRLSVSESSLAGTLASAKYGQATWNERR